MASELKLRRGSTLAHTTCTGAEGEVTYDTDTNELVVHDGATSGGFPGGGYSPASGSPTSIRARLRQLDDGGVIA